ncbi:MAG: sulfotransferase [Parvularculaceae bacterium]
MKAHKVFCIGFQKTGTTSLYAALSRLGYKTAAVVGNHLTARELAEKGAALCIDTAKSYDAAQDMPWPIFFRELDAAFPGSKFILTVREPESWYASLIGHFGARANEMQAFIYGAAFASPVGAKERYLGVLAAHEQSVRDYFRERPDDLLVMDLRAGDDWEKLCAFLGEQAPDAPFPAKNRASDRRTLSYRIRRKLSRAFGKYLAPERI